MTTPTTRDVGAFNGDRVRQATRLVEFADDFAAARDIEAVFLAGDFNSYTEEEPIQVLEAGGFELVESDRRPTRSPTPSAACPARSTTSSATRRPWTW